MAFVSGEGVKAVRASLAWGAASTLAVAVSCNATAPGQDWPMGGTAPGGDLGGDSEGDAAATGTAGDGDDSDDDDGVVLDVSHGSEESGGAPQPVCSVAPGELDAIGPCEDSSPPGSFEPVVQWTFVGSDNYDELITVPLVANLTDDDGNGVIDLCDVPDVVVAASRLGQIGPTRIYILDGQTGAVHRQFEQEVQGGAGPALGDINHDGVPEIVAVGPYPENLPMAFDVEGNVLWTATEGFHSANHSAIALADLEGDGEVEVLISSHVYSATDGLYRFGDPAGARYSATTAADLDGDGQLEVITGDTAYRADGSIYYEAKQVHHPAWLGAPIPHVANLDDDPEPEVLVAGGEGIWMLDHHGEVVFSTFAPTGEGNDWNRPIAIHDMDGDGVPEFGASSREHYGVYKTDLTTLWVASTEDLSGNAGGTAFDFLGAGWAQAVYADETTSRVFDEHGTTLLSTDRRHGTYIEYPVVADIDNDGSAEILVPGKTRDNNGNVVGFTLQAIADAEDRWIPARRIWNQHTYHVTNVAEDGTIPTHEVPSWQAQNTFRTQTPISSNGVCTPVPAG